MVRCIYGMRKSKSKFVFPCELYRCHRWGIDELVGLRFKQLLYAECVELPNYVRGKFKLPLLLTFYDADFGEFDVLGGLLGCVSGVGDTVISRHHGDNKGVVQFRFVNSVVDELVMPKLDYTSGDSSKIVLRVSYDKVIYERV